MAAEIPPTSARVTALLADLTLDERAALTAGGSTFAMRGAPRLGIPGWRTTDGPNGARGSSILGSGEARAVCVPCGSALGATWDVALIERVGELLGDETRTKQARVLLAPTVNLHRSPLGGRNFECFSEDPLLSGKAAAAYIRGVQSRGVITTVKHFVANDSETDRYTIDAVVDERTLRELYLVPFELAVKEGRTAGVMTAYNRVNGHFCAEDRWLLQEVLRGEWGFDGIVMTDWYGSTDTVVSAEAGLDVEMPAGDRSYGAHLAAAVRDGRLDDAIVHVIAERQLRAFERIGALDDEVGSEQSIDLPEQRALARTAAAASMVLLRNEGVLPFDRARVRTLAVLGPNAADTQLMGGGSANLRPHHRTSALDALQSLLGDDVQVVHEPGCSIDRDAPLLKGSALSGARGDGFTVEVFASTDWTGEVVSTTTRDTSRLLFMDEIAPGVTAQSFSARARTTWTPQRSGPHDIELRIITPARVLLDGEVLLDALSNELPPSGAFFGMGRGPLSVTRELVAGTPHELVIELRADQPLPFAGCELGVRAVLPADAMARAVEAARAADAVVLVVGTNDVWETEGEDRTTMDLPGEQDALVAAVLAANPNTVVVVNTGAPVTMDWADAAPAVLQAWFAGQETGPALADVLFGVSEPGGRMPTTIPLRLEHNPSFGNYPGANGEVRYGEGVYVGYRWYTSRSLPVRFAFGHGLSYSTFEIGAPRLSASSVPAGGTVTLTVPVTNTGSRRASHVVQCYVTPAPAALDRPAQELKAFAKVHLDAGERTEVTLVLDARAFSYWDPARPEWPALVAKLASSPMVQGRDVRTAPGWTIAPGTYGILVGASSADIAHRTEVTITPA